MVRVQSLSFGPEDIDIKTIGLNFLDVSDKFLVYDEVLDIYYEGEVLKLYTTQKFKCKLDIPSSYQYDVSNLTILKKDVTIPHYALLTNDKTCRYVWRWLRPVGEDFYKPEKEYPFLNGAYYIHQNINFYLQRQDPYEYVDHFKVNDSPFKFKPNKDNIAKDNTYKSEDEMIC